MLSIPTPRLKALDDRLGNPSLLCQRALAESTLFRASELLSLIWRDIDFRRRVIAVRAAYAKNGESRSIPMNDVLTTTLQAVKMKASTEGPVFRTPQGGPYRNFRTAFERAVQQAGLEDFTFHDLRHTFASRLVMAGVDLPTVKELLGHKGIAMTVWQQSPHNFPHRARTSHR